MDEGGVTPAVVVAEIEAVLPETEDPGPVGELPVVSVSAAVPVEWDLLVGVETEELLVPQDTELV